MHKLISAADLEAMVGDGDVDVDGDGSDVLVRVGC